MPDDARMLLGLAPVHPAGLDHLGATGRAEILAVYPSQSAARHEIELRAQQAAEVDVLAVRGLGIIGLNDSLVRSRIRDRSTNVRVLLLDPECESAHRLAREIGETYGSFSTGIRLSLERLTELAEGAKVEVHVYDMLPTWRVIGLDTTLFVPRSVSGTRAIPHRCTRSPGRRTARCTAGSAGSSASYGARLGG